MPAERPNRVSLEDYGTDLRAARRVSSEYSMRALYGYATRTLVTEHVRTTASEVRRDSTMDGWQQFYRGRPVESLSLVPVGEDPEGLVVTFSYYQEDAGHQRARTYEFLIGTMVDLRRLIVILESNGFRRAGEDTKKWDPSEHYSGVWCMELFPDRTYRAHWALVIPDGLDSLQTALGRLFPNSDY